MAAEEHTFRITPDEVMKATLRREAERTGKSVALVALLALREACELLAAAQMKAGLN